METYITIDGKKKLQEIANDLLFDPVTFESYEKRLCKRVKLTQRKRNNLPTIMVEVHYWTKRDDDTLHCMPSGRRRVYFYGVSDKYEAYRMIEARKQFKREDGSSRIYYMD